MAVAEEMLLQVVFALEILFAVLALELPFVKVYFLYVPVQVVLSAKKLLTESARNFSWAH